MFCGYGWDNKHEFQKKKKKVNTCALFAGRHTDSDVTSFRLKSNCVFSTIPLKVMSSSFHAVFGTALIEYARKTGKDISADPLTARLQSCTSPIGVHEVLQEQAQKFDDFRNGGLKEQIMRRLKPTVDVLLTLSNGGVLGNGIGLVSPGFELL